MRAIQVSAYVKSPNELQVTTLPDIVPKKDEYIIEVKCCAANFFDTLQIRGKYQWQPPLPWIGGSEFSGIIVKEPSECLNNKFKIGDKVFGSSQGAFATMISVKEEHLQPVPKGWTFREASALYLTGPTSYAALILRAQIQNGDWALIHGAAGGVGLGAVQIAKAKAAKVIATSTGTTNIAVLKSYGADYVIDYVKSPKWEDEVMKITSGHGVDVVFDPVGTINQSLKCAAFGARLVPIGFVGGQIESVKVNRILLKNVAIAGLHWGAYAQFDPKTIAQVWDGLFELIDRGRFRATVYERPNGKIFRGLGDVGKAIKLIEDRLSWGKVVVEIDDDEQARL